MNFLAPVAFWFAATLPVVILFYLLKRKRSVHLVSSTILWQKFLAETQASAPFQRLRHNWLLILQLLLLALVILALARPYRAGDVKSSALRVLILDASASMQSTDEAPSRFEKARAEARRWIDGMRDRDQMVLLLAAGHTEVKQSPTSDATALRRALDSCAVTDGPTRLAEALKLAETLVRDRTDAEVHLFSDGVVSDLDDFGKRNLPLVFHRIGERGNNRGIASLEVRAHPENPAQRAIFSSVANHSPTAEAINVELLFEGEVLEVKSVTVGAGETAPLVFTAAQARDGIFTVRLSGTDDLAADNQASAVSVLPRPVRILLVTAGNRFLEKALKVAPQAEVSVATDVTEAAPQADVVVLDGIIPTGWPSKNVLAIHVAPTNWFGSVAPVEAPPIVDWKGTHPLLRFVQFDDVRITASLGVKTPTWAVPVVESPQTPLVLAGEIGRQRVVWVGFDLLQSTWPLRTHFPIFVANAVDWLNPAASPVNPFSVIAGDPFRLPLAEPVARAEVRLPDGTVRSLALDTNAQEVLFGETHRQGTYRMRAGTNEVVFCVNAMHAEESRTEPQSELPIGRYTTVAATTARKANLELWRWVALAAMAVLCFEWWYYHRRTA